ncbi:hypothetical protein Ahy_A09g043891 [Arachis hypogaea]|uniref:SWIM-type domain-containing protein n=1 Tax=Arachis hypogaea TaxID=3818 RepID=A0A445BJ92_ARAHY|nr:hypothetical protein Ahy_A09g043891 [Arachis hypogaea]
MRKESRHWHAIWSGDTGYEKFEVHGRPTNHVVDLGKRLCTCQFWMLTGIRCVHACAALARVNKHPEDFYHKSIQGNIQVPHQSYSWPSLLGTKSV